MVVRPSALQRGRAIKMRRRHRWSVSVRSTDDASHRSYPALQATKGGSSRGNLPLDPVLLPFAGAKGRPRRRGVQTRPCERPRDAVRRLQTRPRRRAVLIKPCIRLCDADRRLQTWPPPGRRASSALRKALRRRQARRKLDGEGVAGAGARDCDGPRTAPRRQAERPMCIL